jgi:hypothetical protein
MGIDSWWDDRWISRSVIQTVTGSPHSSGTHFLRVDADLASLVSEGKLRADYADLRIVCQKSDHNINVPYYIADNATPKRVFFAAQHDIATDINIGADGQAQLYYMYFDNSVTYDEEQPDSYENINFPQAPYSVHADWVETPYGKYRDRHFLRLNDDPSAGPELFTDATNHSSGVSRHHQKIQKGHSGILDQSTFFDGDYVNWATPSGTWIELPQNDHYNWAIPSGDWAVDYWLRVHPKGSSHYGYVLSHALGYTTEFDDPYPRIWYYFLTGSNYARTYAQCNFSSRQHLYNYGQPGRYVPSGSWNHFRIAYRTGGNGEFSRIYLWCNGSGITNLLHDKSTEATNIAEDTCYFSKEETAPVFIGYNYRNEFTDQYMLTGWLEQLRYSTFVYPAVSGIVSGDEYHCAPDWVDEQYVATLGPASLRQSASGFVGGVLWSIETGSASGTVGGYILARGGLQPHIGGILHSITQDRSDSVGGFMWSNVRTSGVMGGFAICSRGDIEVHSMEGLGRTLVKVLSENYEDQRFSADAGFAFYGVEQDSFDAEITVERLSTDEFDARARVHQVRKNPYVEITDVQHSYSGFMPVTCTVTASGHAYDYNNVQLESGIHYVSVVWGDNDFTVVPTPVASGSIWSATHTYEQSGLYRPAVFVRDKYGRTGSDDVELNFASGVEMPYISLSGSPRGGNVPPPLTVDFEVQTSGTLGAYTLYWDFGNGITQYNNALTQTTQYPMPGTYTPLVRIEDQRGIRVVDTLRIGYNR